MDEKEKYYSAKVNVYTEVETSNGGIKEKVEKLEIAVKAITVEEAYAKAYKHFAVSGMMTFEIVGVTASKIIEVI